MTESCKNQEFRIRMIENHRDEKVRRRSDALADEDHTQHLTKNCMCLLIFTSTNNGSSHTVHLLHGGIGKVPGGPFTIQKVKKEVSQVLSERGDPFLAVYGKNFQK